MQRHGIIKEIQDIEETSPNRQIVLPCALPLKRNLSPQPEDSKVECV